jgi:hypothetical protein
MTERWAKAIEERALTRRLRENIKSVFPGRGSVGDTGPNRFTRIGSGPSFFSASGV